jgi:hypothetical protein
MDQGTAVSRAACPSHGQPPFPYAVIRHFSAVYERKAVRFVRDGIVSSPADGAVLVHLPTSVQGRVDEGARALVVARLVELSRISGRQMCAVFSPADAVYVEPSGDTRASADIPRQGPGV